MSTVTDTSRAKSSIQSQRSVDYVGFANFPNQVFRRCIKNGFEFTLMVVGQSGLGKSTFLNTLFMAELHELKVEKPSDINQSKSTVKIECKTFRLVENDVRLKLTIVDTPGFGDFVDNSGCWEPILEFIDKRYADFLSEETKIERKTNIEDKRVHLCLYFIPPTGHGLKQLDIAFLRALQERVNIIPVIGKADTLTPGELSRFKQNIVEDFKKCNIRVYEFPEMEQPIENGNGTISKIAQQHGSNNANSGGTDALRRRIPFAVVGSTHIKEIPIAGSQWVKQDVQNAGNQLADHKLKRVRIREYPWGTVEVDNLAHNDFIPLRDMIIRNHLIDLIDTTKFIHYENYRMRNLPKNNFDNDPFTQLEEETRKSEREAEESRQMKEKVFKDKVSEQEARLLDRAQAMDAEESENRKVLEDKRILLERLKQDVAELKRGGNMSASSLDSGSLGNGSGRTITPPDKRQPMKKKIGHLFGARV